LFVKFFGLPWSAFVVSSKTTRAMEVAYVKFCLVFRSYLPFWQVRSDSHVLIVGDPGLGKSQVCALQIDTVGINTSGIVRWL
jgi:hypothetical protein